MLQNRAGDSLAPDCPLAAARAKRRGSPPVFAHPPGGTGEAGAAGAYKIAQSVLVVIHTPALDVLLIQRADGPDFWQSVTGSKDRLNERFRTTAAREVLEETGIDCRSGSPLASHLRDWHMENVYEIYPRWRHRYAPGVTRNTEHLFSLCIPRTIAVQLNPREHVASRWLPWREAAQSCFSPSNAEAILQLPRWFTPEQGA